MNVLIVGAGPTGLTAAVELARYGIVPTVIDKKEVASTFSRAVGIMPSSLETLAPSRVTERLVAEGVKLREARIFLNARLALTVPLAGSHPDRDYGIALAQDRTESAMEKTLKRLGGTVRYQTALVGLEQTADRVIAQTADGDEHAYDFVLGADGVGSVTRKALGVEFRGHDLPETWSIADVDVQSWPYPAALSACLRSGGRIAVVAPLESLRYRVVSNTDNALEALPFELPVTHIHREGQFRISIRQVTDYQVGRVFLAGDAAHCHSPAGGRGMNLGIADAADWVRRLINSQLDGYGAARHIVGADTIALSERLRKMATSSSLLSRMIRPLACGMIGVLPPVKRRIARTLLSG